VDESHHGVLNVGCYFGDAVDLQRDTDGNGCKRDVRLRWSIARGKKNVPGSGDQHNDDDDLCVMR
jgi:hypothetical protein